MKKVFVIILTYFSLIPLTYSQEIKDNLVYLQGGITDNGYNVTAGFEKLFGVNKNNGLSIDLNYHNLYNIPDVVPIKLKDESYFISVNYKRYFSIGKLSSFYPYAGLGLLGGYQHIDEFSSGIFTHPDENNFIFGGKSLIGTEYRVSKVIGFFLEGSYMFTGDHYFRANAGIKLRI